MDLANPFDFGDCKTAKCKIITKARYKPVAVLLQASSDVTETRQTRRKWLHTWGPVTRMAKALGLLTLAAQLGAPTCSVTRDLLKATRPTGGASVALRLAYPLPHAGVQARGSDVDPDRCCHLGTLGAGGGVPS